MAATLGKMAPDNLDGQGWGRTSGTAHHSGRPCRTSLVDLASCHGPKGHGETRTYLSGPWPGLHQESPRCFCEWGAAGKLEEPSRPRTMAPDYTSLHKACSKAEFECAREWAVWMTEEEVQLQTRWDQAVRAAKESSQMVDFGWQAGWAQAPYPTRAPSGTHVRTYVRTYVRT